MSHSRTISGSVSTNRLLNNLNLAIDQARFTRSSIKSRVLANRTSASIPRRLILINREIELLETKRAQVRCLSDRA